MPGSIRVPYRVYFHAAVETIWNDGEASSQPVRVRPLPGQGLPGWLRVQCDRGLLRDHPVGSIFILWLKLMDREGTPELYSYFRWRYVKVDRAFADAMIQEKRLGFTPFSRNADVSWYEAEYERRQKKPAG